jgi:hypothetical protein
LIDTRLQHVFESGGRRRVGRWCCAGWYGPTARVTCGLDHVRNGIDHEIGLVNLNVVSALLGEDLPAVWEQRGEIRLLLAPATLTGLNR